MFFHNNSLYRRSNRLHKHKKSFLRNKGRKQKACFFWSLLLLITLFIVGTTQNRLELKITAQRLKSEGIDYDSFREMLIPVKTLDKVKVTFNRNSEKAADYVTVFMLLNKYDLRKGKNPGKRNMEYFIKELSDNNSFKELKSYYHAILSDIKCFPVAPDSEGRFHITFTDTWNQHRSYGGNRRHEGTDLMSGENIRGQYPVVSMTDGVVEKMGWLEKGGYRIGIRGKNGAYFYYAHLESYAMDLKIGDAVVAGQLLGYMGDSGYGPEGTVGKFDVHLHVGIYVDTDFGELSVNPYWILLYLETQNAKNSR
ncbi:MAG: Peptidase-M23 domain-containing protein [Lachnoclostridium sp.]|jgi:peptidoglycan LD-endopeptidase LytH